MAERKISLGKTTEISPGEMKRFKLGFRNALIVNTGAGFKAYYDFCTHQGGQLKIEKNIFCCVRHQATFSVDSGARLSGQAPEGSKLGEIPITTEGDELFVTWHIPEE